jgi:hypothetical protein
VLNDPVRFREHVGFIEHISPLSIQIKTDTDEIVDLPYEHLRSDLLIKRQVKGKLLSDKLKLTFQNSTEKEILDLLEVWLYTCPWAVKSTKNAVQIIGDGELVLNVYAVDKETLMKASTFIRAKVSESDLLRYTTN